MLKAITEGRLMVKRGRKRQYKGFLDSRKKERKD
jgi:hypothetical protein